jgi:hypothetical protein
MDQSGYSDPSGTSTPHESALCWHGTSNKCGFVSLFCVAAMETPLVRQHEPVLVWWLCRVKRLQWSCCLHAYIQLALDELEVQTPFPGVSQSHRCWDMSVALTRCPDICGYLIKVMGLWLSSIQQVASRSRNLDIVPSSRSCYESGLLYMDHRGGFICMAWVIHWAEESRCFPFCD